MKRAGALGFPWKVRSWLIACGLLFCVATTSQAMLAGTDTLVSFDPLHTIVISNDTLVVDVVIGSDIIDLRGFSWIVQFDPTIVTIVKVEPGSLLNSASCDDFVYWLNEGSVVNTIEVDHATLGCSVSGPGAVIHMSPPGPRSIPARPGACNG